MSVTFEFLLKKSTTRGEQSPPVKEDEHIMGSAVRYLSEPAVHTVGGSVVLSLSSNSRILQPDGAFICISHVGPEERLELLEYWDLDTPEKCFAWDVYVDLIRELYT